MAACYLSQLLTDVTKALTQSDELVDNIEVISGKVKVKQSMRLRSYDEPQINNTSYS